MLKLAALTVVVTFVGGPRSAAQHRPSDAPALGSLIEVLDPSTGVSATSRFGDLDLQVPPGTYTVTARVGPGDRPCGGGPRAVRVGMRGTRVHIYCGIR
jgi:hypothetical protein